MQVLCQKIIYMNIMNFYIFCNFYDQVKIMS